MFVNPFDKIKSRVRRSLESTLLESKASPKIVISESKEKMFHQNRLRAQSLLLHPSPSVTLVSRSRSRSVSKKHTKELIRHETNQVVQRKLNQVLLDLGLNPPIPLKTCSGYVNGPTLKSSKIYVANSHDCIYLAPASSASFTYEDVENGGIEEENNMSSFVVPEDPASAATSRRPSTEGLARRMESFNSPNYLCTKIDSDTPIPHTFGVIIELEKETQCTDVVIDFESLTNILWPSDDVYNKTFSKERFAIGSLRWTTALNQCDFYINSTNSNDIKSKSVTNDDLALRTRNYRLKNIHRDQRDPEPEEELASPILYKPGFYVFLLPILIPEHIPPTIVSVNGSLVHNLTVTFNRISEKLNRKSKVVALYNLPMVRTPPSFANSIADKPIYVNRVWNDALHYVITFPKKYVSLGSEHLMNVKLVPLVKDVIIKRIRFNVLERITYVSKDLSKEYDYDGDDPYNLKGFSDNRPRERIVPVCELKTKNKPSTGTQMEPYKEEVIKCPDNNLLFSCYEPEEELDLNDPLSKPKNTMIASPLDINVALPFLTTRQDKEMLTACGQDEEPAVRSRKSSVMSLNSVDGPLSPIIGALETNFSHGLFMDDTLRPDVSSFMHDESNYRESIHHGYTSVSKALSPDSNFRHIQVNHRLQVCFRISKPDPNDNYKMHHYEVVVDTPFILLSAKCNDESIQLPRYDESEAVSPPPLQPSISFRTPNFENSGISIKPLDPNYDELPSFEQATLTPSSPIMRSISILEDPLSRVPSISPVPLDPAPAYTLNAPPTPPPTEPLIDQLVTSEGRRISTNPQSRIRSSLVSSFAPSSTTLRSDGDESSLPTTASIPSTEDSVIRLNTGSDSAPIDESPFVSDTDSLDDAEDAEQNPQESLYTQDTGVTATFDQHLSLLANQSIDSLRNPSLDNVAERRKGKPLTDNLSIITELGQPNMYSGL